ncbi:hypothetical protein NW762_011525 [Fusarium torreyae]|uniref:Transcription factor domain-containing protein n=1 Tax=Fusarium torreyae TaxID=1237075 RepID=A0A9W8RT92_9HYPO|nr:hypothetical protein NW762_011525 [Fusarium torreyae]
MSEFSDYDDYLNSSYESYTSIKEWAEDIDFVMHAAQSTSSSHAGEQESLTSDRQASASDNEFNELVEELQAAREIVQDIEDRLLQLYYDRLHDESVSSTRSSQLHKSDSGITIENPNSGEHKPTSNNQSHKGHNQELTNPSKKDKMKQKKPRTEEQVNRHINKVFMRENNRRQQCVYRAEVSHERMLELRKGSKDLLQALELLRTAPEDSVAALLQDLRSRGSVSDFLQSVDSGSMATSSPINPLVASLAGTSAKSHVELDLNMRYPNAFPRLETFEVTDVDLSLLTVQKPNPALLNSQSAVSVSHYLSIEYQNRTSETPTSSGFSSSPSDATGDSAHHVDSRLEFLRIWQWTSVPIPDSLAAQAISFYLVNEHPVLAFFDADLFIRDLTSGGGRFCSPLLVSSLLAWCCFEPRAQALSLSFLNEAKLRWREQQDYNFITTLSSAMLLVLTCNQHGHDRIGLVYLDASVSIGRRLGLFRDDDTPPSGIGNDDDHELQSAASFAAWGSFGWHSSHSINFRAEHRIRYPPTLPIPGDISGPPLGDYMGSTFTSISKFWLIIHEAFRDGYANFCRLPMSNANHIYHLLLDWASILPDDTKRSDGCPHHVLVLHIWYHSAIIDIWRPFLEISPDEYTALNGTANAAYEASVHQLKRLIYLYRKRFESTNQTMLITPGLLSLINEVFRNPGASDAQFWFILAARGCLSIALWCRGLRGIAEGLMTIGSQSGVFEREGWVDNSMVRDIRATTRLLVRDGMYNSVYPINLDSISENLEDIGMEALAGEFRRLNRQHEPREKNIEAAKEPEIWKGDPRDLSLTLSEATESEEYI